MKKATIIGFLFTVLFGTLLHFTYEWSGYSNAVGVFSAVNESIWEHTKLLAVPMLVFAVFEYFSYGKELDNFIPVRLLSILIGIAVIIGGYYIYSGIIGRDIMVADIALFVIAVFISYAYSYKMLNTNKFSSGRARLWSLFGIVLLIAIYVTFTFYPPHINLFADPLSGTYGIM